VNAAGACGIIAAEEGSHMVTLYVGGKKVEWTEAAQRFTEPSAEAEPIELRDDTGKVVARIKIELAENDPDWVKAITPEEIERRMAGEFLTFDELKQRLGWK
jgi:hypothetical protein